MLNSLFLSPPPPPRWPFFPCRLYLGEDTPLFVACQLKILVPPRNSRPASAPAPTGKILAPPLKSPSRKSHVRQFSRSWVGRGFLVAVTRYMWLLRGVRGCYGFCIPLFSTKIALHGSYGTDLREGVTMAPLHKICVWTQILCNGAHDL